MASVRRRREVALLGSRGKVGAVDADHDTPPRAVALRVAGRVADRVLARQLVGDLSVDAVQIRELTREERTAACFLGELAQHELGFLEAAGTASAELGDPQ